MKQFDFIALKLRWEKGGEETVCALVGDNRNTKTYEIQPSFFLFSPGRRRGVLLGHIFLGHILVFALSLSVDLSISLNAVFCL